MQLRAGGSLLLLVESFPQLLSASFDALAAQDAQLNAAAADALVELLSGHNSQLALGSEAAAAATRLVSERLQQLATTLRVSEALKAGEEVEERVYHACRVFCAFAERAVDLVAATEGALLPVAQLQLLCLGGELRVAELTTDFWTSLQDTPLAQRHAQLREPLYRELQQRVLALCTLPADFATNWDEYGGAIEEEDFTRFREQGAAEVLSQCLQLLHTEFVDGLRQTMGDGSQWQRLEVVLFAVRALHIDVKGTLQQEADGGGGLPPARQQAHKHAVEQLLRDLCAPIASENAIFRAPPAGSAAPPLVLSAARLVGTFGKWINAQGEAEQLMYGCVRFVLGALQVSDVAEAAAEAFRALCVHGRRQLARAETIHGMLQACAPSLRAEELPAELRVALVEGLARLVAQLSKPEEAAHALHALVEAPCTTLGALLQQAPPPPPPGAPPVPPVPPEMGAAVATQLQLIAAAIRYCDQFRPERHPVLPVLQHCWPLLQAVGARFALPVVVQALCELYSRSMTALKQLLRPLLPQLLGQIHAVFGSTPVIGCLTCVSQAIETYAAEDDAEENEVANALSHVTGGLVESICAFIRGAPDPEAQPELLTAFFEMCHRTLVCHPALLLNLAAVPTLFDAAIACVCHQEFQHTRAALTFLCLFMSGTQDAGAASRGGGALHARARRRPDAPVPRRPQRHEPAQPAAQPDRDDARPRRGVPRRRAELAARHRAGARLPLRRGRPARRRDGHLRAAARAAGLPLDGRLPVRRLRLLADLPRQARGREPQQVRELRGLRDAARQRHDPRPGLSPSTATRPPCYTPSL